MPELDPFEARLAAAVRSFAGHAETSVDAAAVAERTVRRRRAGSLGVLGRLVPVPISILLLLALLLAMLAWSIGAGGPWGNRAVILAPDPTASPMPTERASPTPAPSTSGRGDQYVTGTATLAVTTPPTRTPSGALTQERGGVATIIVSTNDRRASGTATLAYSRDVFANVATQWGTWHLGTNDGAWDGTCRGESLAAGSPATWSCWLVGSGAYEGYASYLALTWDQQNAGRLEGILYPGSPPQT